MSESESDHSSNDVAEFEQDTNESCQSGSESGHEYDENHDDDQSDEDNPEVTNSKTGKKKADKAAKDRKEQREKRKFDFEQNTRTIFVGNLPTSLDHRSVAKLFKNCGGNVESARIRSVVPEKEKLAPKVALITKRIHPKVDSVNAYVVFEKSENVEETIKRALAMNGKLIEGHHIRVDRAQHPNSKRMTLSSRKKSVFVGNLRFDLRDDDLINHFKKVGEVDYVRLVRDKATGLGKGFGFVKFNERAAVKKALELNDTDFKGRKLRIKKIDEKAPSLEENKKSEQRVKEPSRNNDVPKKDIKTEPKPRKARWKASDKKFAKKKSQAKFEHKKARYEKTILKKKKNGRKANKA